MSPNKKNENMGGVFAPEFIFVDQVKSTFIEQITASMYVVCTDKWIPFPEGKTEISVQPYADVLYDVNCTIKIPRTNITDEFRLLIEQMKMRTVIIRYKQSDGLYRVIGSKQNALSLIIEDSAPQVTSFNGSILTFSGLQPHQQLMYKFI